MNKIKAFISDPRCLTLDIQPKLEIVSRETRFDADIFILYQDYLNIEKTYMDEALVNKIPVLVIQHGRQATRDYSKEGRDLRADKICLWGTLDVKRMRGLGYPKDKLVLTGSPILEHLESARISPDAFSPVRTILFNPKYYPYIIEPNFAILRQLVKTPHKIIIKTITDDRNINVYNQFVEKYNNKVELVASSPKGRPMDHYEKMIECLIKASICVGVEESINELMATVMDIPIVMVKDAWPPGKFLHFNGTHDVMREGMDFSSASYKCRIKDVARKVESVLKVDDRQYQRIQVGVEEGGFGMPTAELIMNEIKKLTIN